MTYLGPNKGENNLGKYGLDMEEEGEKLSWENYFKKVYEHTLLCKIHIYHTLGLLL